MRHIVLLSLLLGAACSGNNETAKTDTKTGAKADKKASKSDAKSKKNNFELDEADLLAAAKAADVPRPKAMLDSLEANDLSSDLYEHIQKRTYFTEASDKHRTAVAVGAMLSELVFSVYKAPTADLVKQMRSIQTAFKSLKAGSDIQMEIDDLIEEINGSDFNRAEFLTTIDELSTVSKAEWEEEMGQWVVPLIQAGSWLAGSNVISTGTLAQGKADKAGKLFKQPGIPSYFLTYVKREGKGKTSDVVLKKLENTLVSLKTIANKKSVVEADLNEIKSLTGQALDLL